MKAHGIASGGNGLGLRGAGIATIGNAAGTGFRTIASGGNGLGTGWGAIATSPAARRSGGGAFAIGGKRPGTEGGRVEKSPARRGSFAERLQSGGTRFRGLYPKILCPGAKTCWGSWTAFAAAKAPHDAPKWVCQSVWVTSSEPMGYRLPAMATSSS